MDTINVKLAESIEYCLLPKLSKNFEESQHHSEFVIRNSRLDKHFHEIFKKLEEINLEEKQRISSSTLSSLIIIYHELQSTGPWNTEKSIEYSNKLEYYFELMFEISLKKIFLNKNVFNSQEVFDKCLETLHQKLSSTDFKKYPSLIEVYCVLLQDAQNYNVKFNPISTLPISLLLIDDYTTNKIKGLKCCRSILQCLSAEDFIDGNYYEVIYGCLKKASIEKDGEITELVLNCFLDLLKILPSNVKIKKTDELYSNILEQLYTEGNLYRKKTLFSFCKDVIHMHRVHCIKKKKAFIAIVCDNIDTCCNKAVAEILLSKVLECLEEWIKHCWCSWKLSAPSDQKLLSILFKLIYVLKDEGNAKAAINLIVTLVSLCSVEEKNQIIENLETPLVKCEHFTDRIGTIKKNI